MQSVIESPIVIEIISDWNSLYSLNEYDLLTLPDVVTILYLQYLISLI